MNTNLNMLPLLKPLVHMPAALKCRINAQKFGKMAPHWAK